MPSIPKQKQTKSLADKGKLIQNLELRMIAWSYYSQGICSNDANYILSIKKNTETVLREHYEKNR